MNDKLREFICEIGYEDSVLFVDPDYDDAIVGVTTEGQIVYDYDKMVADMIVKDDMEGVDAIEFIEYNTIRSLPYSPDPKPIIMYKFKE